MKLGAESVTLGSEVRSENERTGERGEMGGSNFYESGCHCPKKLLNRCIKSDVQNCNNIV